MKLFGTDGIRGLINQGPMTVDMIQKIAIATADYLRKRLKLSSSSPHNFTVVIGKDTRLSGYMVENALTAGFLSMGAKVHLLGPVPTPAVAMLTRSLRGHLGVMISASHNPYYDNGIKFFDERGFKLNDEDQKAIEEIIHNNLKDVHYAEPGKIGKAKRIDDAIGRYIEDVKSSFPESMRLDGLKVVVDCANGAAYKIAPLILWELGAEVITIHNTPNGTNINDKCGATNPKSLQEKVLAEKADVGFALDGDADRLIMVDEKGQVIDGDQIITAITLFLHRNNLLKGNGLVATQMSNLGMLEKLAEYGLDFHRSNVGDRHVLKMMQETGCNVGGEQSGHIILSDHSTTGDAIMACLQVLALLVSENKKASDIGSTFTPMPQVFKNITLTKNVDLQSTKFLSQMHDIEKLISKTGQIIVRKSGTEPLIRIMAQGPQVSVLNQAIEKISNLIA